MEDETRPETAESLKRRAEAKGLQEGQHLIPTSKELLLAFLDARVAEIEEAAARHAADYFAEYGYEAGGRWEGPRNRRALISAHILSVKRLKAIHTIAKDHPFDDVRHLAFDVRTSMPMAVKRRVLEAITTIEDASDAGDAQGALLIESAGSDGFAPENWTRWRLLSSDEKREIRELDRACRGSGPGGEPARRELRARIEALRARRLPFDPTPPATAASLDDVARRLYGEETSRLAPEGEGGPFFVALFTEADEEVTGGNYARQRITRNGETIRFPQATSLWGRITSFAIVDATGRDRAGGRVICPNTVGVGDEYTIYPGDIFPLDNQEHRMASPANIDHPDAGGTVIQKVEIMITSTQDPNRIARSVKDILAFRLRDRKAIPVCQLCGVETEGRGDACACSAPQCRRVGDTIGRWKLIDVQIRDGALASSFWRCQTCHVASSRKGDACPSICGCTQKGDVVTGWGFNSLQVDKEQGFIERSFWTRERCWHKAMSYTSEPPSACVQCAPERTWKVGRQDAAHTEWICRTCEAVTVLMTVDVPAPCAKCASAPPTI